MPLVSPLYRWIPSDHVPSKVEQDRRLSYKLQRLVSEYGAENVIRRLREAKVDKSQEVSRAFLILHVLGCEDRKGHAGGTI